jgi:hypothetical protein
MPQTLQSAWTRLERHTVPRTASNTSQYSESARGKSAARGWHLSSLLLRIPGGVPPGHVKGKEHAQMLRHSLSKAQPLRETDCLTLDVMHLLEHNRALITIYFPFPVR